MTMRMSASGRRSRVHELRALTTTRPVEARMMATFRNSTAIADSQRAFSLGVAINAKGVKLSHPLTAAADGRSVQDGADNTS